MRLASAKPCTHREKNRSRASKYGRFSSRRSRERRHKRFFHIEPHIADVSISANLIFFETTADNTAHGRWNQIPLRLNAKNRGHGIGSRLAAKGLPAAEHFIQNASERPDIGSLV